MVSSSQKLHKLENFFLVFILLLLIVECVSALSYYSSEKDSIQEIDLIVSENFFAEELRDVSFSAISKSIDFDVDTVTLRSKISVLVGDEASPNPKGKIYFCFSVRERWPYILNLRPDINSSGAYSFRNTLERDFDEETETFCFTDTAEQFASDYYNITLTYSISKLENRALIRIIYYCALKCKCEDIEINVPENYCIKFAPESSLERIDKVVFEEKEERRPDPFIRAPTPDYDKEILIEKCEFYFMEEFEETTSPPDYGSSVKELVLFLGAVASILIALKALPYKRIFNHANNFLRKCLWLGGEKELIKLEKDTITSKKKKEPKRASEEPLLVGHDAIDLKDVSILNQFPRSPEIVCNFTVLYKRKLFSSEKIDVWPYIQMNPPLFGNYWGTEKVKLQVGKKQESQINVSLKELQLKEYMEHFRGPDSPHKGGIAESSRQEVTLNLQLYLQKDIEYNNPIYEMNIQTLCLEFPSRMEIFSRIVDSETFKRTPPIYLPFLVHEGDRYSKKYVNLCFLSKKFLSQLRNSKRRRFQELDRVWQDIARLTCEDIMGKESYRNCHIERFPSDILDPMNDPTLIDYLVGMIEESDSLSGMGKGELYIGIYQTKCLENFLHERNAKGVFLFGLNDTEDIACIFDLSQEQLYSNCDLDKVERIEEVDFRYIEPIVEHPCISIHQFQGERRVEIETINEIVEVMSQGDYYQALKSFAILFSEYFVYYGAFVVPIPEFSKRWVDIRKFSEILKSCDKSTWFKKFLEESIVRYVRLTSDYTIKDFSILNLCSKYTDITDKTLKILNDWKSMYDLKKESVDIIESFHTRNGWNFKGQLLQNKMAIIVAASDLNIRELSDLINCIERFPYNMEPYILMPIFSLVDIQARINKYRNPGSSINIDVFPIFLLRNQDLLVSKKINILSRI